STKGRPLEVDCFAGTSIGAFNAAFMTAFSRLGFAEAADRLVALWLQAIARQPNGCENGLFRLRGGEALDPRCALQPPSIERLASDGLYALREFLPRAQRSVRIVSESTPDPFTRAILIQIDFTTLLDLTPYINTMNRAVPLDELRAATVDLKIVA